MVQMPETERQYTFVVFRQGDGQGRVTMHDVDYTEESARATLKHECGEDAEVIAAVSNLSVEEVSNLNVIFDTVTKIEIATSDDIRRLLSFTPPTKEMRPVRTATKDVLPSFLKRTNGDLKKLPIVMRLFELYEIHGDDEERLQSAIDAEVATMNSSDRSNCLIIFQTMLHQVQPRIRAWMHSCN